MASLNEGSKRKDYGKKGGQGGTRSTSNTPFDRRESSANMQDPARRTKGGRKAPVPSWLTKSPEEVKQTPLNRYIRGQEESGRRVSEPLKDAAGISDAASRGDIKPVQAGESKPTAGQGQLNRTRARGQAAAAGVDVTPEPSRRAPRNVRLADTTKGGPVKTMRLGDPGAPSKDAARTLQRMTTASPEQTRALQDKLVKADTPKKPEPIKQSEVSKRAARFRQSFGTPTGADPRTGAPTYRPLDAMTDLPKGRGGRAPSPEQYGRTKVGDLDAKRILRTMGPKGEPTTRGVQNFALNRETQGRFSPSTRRGRTLSPADSKSAMDKVDRIMSDPKQVADIKGRIRQEVGGRRAQTTSPNPVPSRSTSASAASTRVIKRVQVKDITPPQRTLRRAALPPASSSAPSTAPVRTTAPTVAPTKTKVELPKLKLTRAPERPAQPKAPAPSFSVPGTTKQTKAPQLPPVGGTSVPAQPKTTPVKTDTPGQNLEFGKTKTGSFTYKPSTKAPATTATPAPPSAPAAPSRQMEPPAASTIRRRSGDAGPSSRLNAGQFTPQKSTTRGVTTSQAAAPPTDPNLGRRSSTYRSGTSTYRPGTKDKSPSTKAGPLSMAGDALYGGLVGYDAYQKAKERGQSDAYAYRQAAAQGGTTAVASALGGAAGRRIGARFPGWTKALAIPAGDFLGSAAAGYLGQTASQGIVGASKSDRDWMKWANRSVQQGTAPKNATSRTGSRAVVRDANNKERVGYLAYKDGKPVYKHGNDPSSLQYTSSNPLERIGRTIGSSDSLGPVSNWFKGYYSRKDEATRRRDVAAQRTKAGN